MDTIIDKVNMKSLRWALLWAFVSKVKPSTDNFIHNIRVDIVRELTHDFSASLFSDNHTI